jgi:diguanylate cyclase (GGDEF)-like protein
VGFVSEGPPADLGAAIEALWQERKGDVIARLAVAEEAVAAALTGELGAELRDSATLEAHKLAGVAGTFGFPGASERARELELTLRAPGPLDTVVHRMAELTVAIRQELEAPAAEPGPAVPSLGAPAAAAGEAGPPTPPMAEPGALDLLVTGGDAERGARLSDEAAVRGLRAAFAPAPAQARAIATARRPAAVLLDLDVDGGSEAGLELLAELAHDRPVIVVTDSEESIDRVEVARRGGRGFLPRSMTVAALIDAVVALRDRTRAAGSSVLALDDDPVALSVLAGALRSAGLEVETIDAPERLWPALERLAPDLLVLDYDMPGISGPELCRSIRNDARWQRLPVVFLTARRDAASIEALFAAGADDYVTKPFVGPELLARVTNRLERVRLFQALAYTDPLTGLANRRRGLDALETLRRLSDRHGQPFALAIFDCDRFKSINDGGGHALGDAVLRGIAAALGGHFRGEDVVSRWGGDEFVVGIYGMSGEDGRGRVADLLERVRAQRLGGAPGPVTLSGGLARYPHDGTDIEALYRAADGALYRAKALGGDRVVLAGDETAAVDAVDVVIVEDDEILGGLIEHALQTRGYRTRWLTDGADAASKLAAADPEIVAPVVLLDWDLPALDGLRVLNMMRETGVLARTHVIMATGRASEAEILSALDAGAADHVAKPLSVPVLMQRVRRALERRDR